MMRFLLFVIAVSPSFISAKINNPFMAPKVEAEQKQSEVEASTQLVERVEAEVSFQSTAATSPNIIYKYDALGRLVCVQDAVAGNRKFVYDDAGNRTNVSTAACD
ncbi:RHS repeat domain-containing protein [Rheinheimera pleomorphica]|uniref:RHS repeat domain-containing protein n=1 Tax=Rheinheimera pleomorphica TaxID=2703963 RepID=UPI0014226BAB|nr:RHS repeat domain-containing protein [Rheinheimera pleomorphica]